MAEYIRDFINDEDGKRAWHRTLGVTEYGGSGFCLWVGRQDVKKEMLDVIRANQWDVADYGGFRGFMAREYFAKSELILASSLSRMFYVDKDDGRLVHHYGDCGESWIGVSRSPLPEGWDKPEAYWPGWAHIMHRSAHWGESGRIPTVDDVFGFVRATRRDYPVNLGEVSREIVSSFGLEKIPKELLILYFPWLDDKLGKNIRDFIV